MAPGARLSTLFLYYCLLQGVKRPREITRSLFAIHNVVLFWNCARSKIFLLFTLKGEAVVYERLPQSEVQLYTEICKFKWISIFYFRGIEWSLRAFASMRAVRLFLQAWAETNFLMRAASTLEITLNGEQRALRKFSVSWNLSLLLNVVLRKVFWLTPRFKTGQQAQS